MNTVLQYASFFYIFFSNPHAVLIQMDNNSQGATQEYKNGLIPSISMQQKYELGY